jgi:hypothetical protein
MNKIFISSTIFSQDTELVRAEPRVIADQVLPTITRSGNEATRALLPRVHPYDHNYIDIVLKGHT